MSIDKTPLTPFDEWKGNPPMEASVNLLSLFDWFKNRKAKRKPKEFHWPKQNLDAMVAFYGKPRENLEYIALPYHHRLSWDTAITITRFLCHERVKPSLERVLTRVLTAYGLDAIENLHLNVFGGCFAYRPKTGTPGSLSTHSWGAAIDYDPQRNAYPWGKDKAVFAQPEYETWWRIWEEEGWVSLGRERNFDWMHIQAARL